MLEMYVIYCQLSSVCSIEPLCMLNKFAVFIQSFKQESLYMFDRVIVYVQLSRCIHAIESHCTRAIKSLYMFNKVAAYMQSRVTLHVQSRHCKHSIERIHSIESLDMFN